MCDNGVASKQVIDGRLASNKYILSYMQETSTSFPLSSKQANAGKWLRGFLLFLNNFLRIIVKKLIKINLYIIVHLSLKEALNAKF